MTERKATAMAKTTAAAAAKTTARAAGTSKAEAVATWVMVTPVWVAGLVFKMFGEVDRMLHMMKIGCSRMLVGLGLMGVVGLVGCGHSGVQQQQQPVAAMAPEAGGTVAGVREIHVNQDCLILQDRVDGVLGVSVPGAQAVAGGETDDAVCHLESKLTSNHVKGEVVNGAVQRSVVVVNEQEYLLQDEFQQPVVFVVEHLVPDGWAVDSDPQPTKMEGKVALFRVTAQPGQIVRLHVGEQHMIPLASPAGD
jgi:hypothetical protein